jgi:hypothetical protein
MVVPLCRPVPRRLAEYKSRATRGSRENSRTSRPNSSRALALRPTGVKASARQAEVRWLLRLTLEVCHGNRRSTGTISRMPVADA